MSKAEKFINDYTRNDSNIAFDASCGYIDWITPDDTRKAVEIARDEIYEQLKNISFAWKPITEIPTEHWANNYAISPLYMVRCGEKDGVSVLGYSNYSFATKSWLDCFQATSPGVHKVTEWTDIKI